MYIMKNSFEVFILAVAHEKQTFVYEWKENFVTLK